MHSRTFLEMRFAWRIKEKNAKTSCPRLGLEVPDILLPDVGAQPKRFWDAKELTAEIFGRKVLISVCIWQLTGGQ